MSSPGQSIARQDGIVYARHDDLELAGDLYLPAGAGPHPIVLAVPGGAWRFGQRSGLRRWAEYLAAHGHAVFSIDYRQAVRGPSFPHAAQDVLAAAQYLIGNGARHRLDPARLSLLGASAGAQLAALIALAADREPFFGAYPADAHAAIRPRFSALIAAYGIYDLFAHWQETRSANAASADDIVERFLGCSPFENPDWYTLASPLRHIVYRHSALKVFLTWGTRDTAVSPSQSEAFRVALEQARFFVRTCPVVGAGHYWFSEDPIDDPHGFTAVVAPRIVRFLERINDAPRPSD
jgi:acetyl esterase/lipase